MRAGTTWPAFSVRRRASRTSNELKRESARLCKRFQAVKERLTEMARREGLLQR